MLNVQVGLELPQRLLEIQEGLDALWTANDVVGMGTGVLWCITLRIETQLSTVRCFKRNIHFFRVWMLKCTRKRSHSSAFAFAILQKQFSEPLAFAQEHQ